MDLERVLLDSADEILEDLDARLDEVAHMKVEGLRQFAKRAIATFREGQPESAQALATSLLTNIMHHRFGFDRFNLAREDWQKENPRETVLRLYRFKLILWAFARSLHHTDHAEPGFNRHATAGHYPDLFEQFTRANSLQALMLLTAVVRELDYSYAALDRAEESDENEAAAA
jgi:hypothetical protein